MALYINWRICQTWRIYKERRATYEEPHAGTEASGSESVERADGVDVDGVGTVGASGTRRTRTSHCVWQMSDVRSKYSDQAREDAYVSWDGA